MIGKTISLSKHSFLDNGGLLRFGNKVGFGQAIKERNRSPPCGNCQVAFTISKMI